MNISSKKLTNNSLLIRVTQLRKNVSIVIHKQANGVFKVALFNVKNNIDVFIENKPLYDSHYLLSSFKKKTSFSKYMRLLQEENINYNAYEILEQKKYILNGKIIEVNDETNIVSVQIYDFFGRVKVKISGHTDVFIDEILNYECPLKSSQKKLTA